MAAVSVWAQAARWYSVRYAASHYEANEQISGTGLTIPGSFLVDGNFLVRP